MQPVGIKRTETINLWDCAACCAPVALTADHETRLRKYGETFYCPHGHHNSFSDSSELSRVKAKLAEQARIATEQAARAQREQERALQAEFAEQRAVNERNAVQREMKRLKTRAAAGVCPCCNRTFVKLAQHMKTKHPEAAK
jgi:hypothetical protein